MYLYFKIYKATQLKQCRGEDATAFDGSDIRSLILQAVFVPLAWTLNRPAHVEMK